MAVELKNRLQSGLGISLGATLVFDYPTVEALADHLQGELVFMKAPKPSSGTRATRSRKAPGRRTIWKRHQRMRSPGCSPRNLRLKKACDGRNGKNRL